MASPCSGPAEGGLYDITVALEDVNQGYTVTATARDDRGQKDDTKCKTLTLNDVGVKGVVGRRRHGLLLALNLALRALLRVPPRGRLARSG